MTIIQILFIYLAAGVVYIALVSNAVADIEGTVHFDNERMRTNWRIGMFLGLAVLWPIGLTVELIDFVRGLWR